MNRNKRKRRYKRKMIEEKREKEAQNPLHGPDLLLPFPPPAAHPSAPLSPGPPVAQRTLPFPPWPTPAHGLASPLRAPRPSTLHPLGRGLPGLPARVACLASPAHPARTAQCTQRAPTHHRAYAAQRTRPSRCRIARPVTRAWATPRPQGLLGQRPQPTPRARHAHPTRMPPRRPASLPQPPPNWTHDALSIFSVNCFSHFLWFPIAHLSTTLQIGTALLRLPWMIRRTRHCFLVAKVSHFFLFLSPWCSLYPGHGFLRPMLPCAWTPLWARAAQSRRSGSVPRRCSVAARRPASAAR
jgi:hypothetical protein